MLFNAAQGGWAQRIRVVPGMDGDTWWFGSELLVWPNYRQRSVTGWTEDQDIDYDYGLITLNTGFSLGSFGLLYASDTTLDSTTAYITGYPAEKGTPPGTQQFGVPGGGGSHRLRLYPRVLLDRYLEGTERLRRLPLLGGQARYHCRAWRAI